jgi:uncharacterized membrane protein (DUF485 family)
MPYITLPDNTSFPVLDGETPEQALEAAKLKYPEAFGLPPNTTNLSHTIQTEANDISLEGAYLVGIAQLVSSVMWIVLLVYFAKAWKKSYNPLQLSIKWAVWFGGFGGCVYFSRAIGVLYFNLKYKESLEGLIVGCILLTISIGFIGFIFGWLYGKFYKFKADIKS